MIEQSLPGIAYLFFARSFFPDAECSGFTLSNISPPSFLTTSTADETKVPLGKRVAYTCEDSDKMLPFESDVDSNFEFEVVCDVEAGITRFIRPNWPSACVTKEVNLLVVVMNLDLLDNQCSRITNHDAKFNYTVM